MELAFSGLCKEGFATHDGKDKQEGLPLGLNQNLSVEYGIDEDEWGMKKEITWEKWKRWWEKHASSVREIAKHCWKNSDKCRAVNGAQKLDEPKGLDQVNQADVKESITDVYV